MGVGRVPGGKHRRIDILTIPFENWGAALIYFTGNEVVSSRYCKLADSSSTAPSACMRASRAIRSTSAACSAGSSATARATRPRRVSSAWLGRGMGAQAQRGGSC